MSGYVGQDKTKQDGLEEQRGGGEKKCALLQETFETGAEMFN